MHQQQQQLKRGPLPVPLRGLEVLERVLTRAAGLVRRAGVPGVVHLIGVQERAGSAWMGGIEDFQEATRRALYQFDK